MTKNFRMAVISTAVVLTACGGGGSDQIDGPVWSSRGVIVNEAGAGIANVTTSVTLDKVYSTTTDANGNYVLDLPRDYAFPTYFSGIATKAGILPQPIFFSYENSKLSFNNRVQTRETKETDIIFHSTLNVIHLGDSNYSGSINSQFQFPKASGTVWSEDFTLQAEQKSNYSQLCIHFFAKGINPRATDAQTTLSLSNKGQAGTFMVRPLSATDADGAYSGLNECFSLATFKALDTIRVQLNSLKGSSDYDDFEFIAVTGLLK